MSIRLTLWTILGMTLAAPAEAQTYDGLAIQVEARTIHADGGERGNTAFAASPVTVGETRSGAFAKLPEMCGFGVAARLLPGGTGGWTASVTPLRVEDSAVTFRLEWARLAGATPSGVGGTSEITLRPGESLPLDLVPLPADGSKADEQCGVRAAALHVKVEHRPRPERDTRLLATELWFIERLADGTERAQSASLRGRPNEETTFYFDPITDDGVTFELHGDIAVDLDTEHASEVAATVRARGRIDEQGSVSTLLAVGRVPSGPLMGSRSVESLVRFALGQVVDVQLPRLTENAGGAFDGWTFWLRIRVRQLR